MSVYELPAISKQQNVMVNSSLDVTQQILIGLTCMKNNLKHRKELTEI
jgi:hypothetical protein